MPLTTFFNKIGQTQTQELTALQQEAIERFDELKRTSDYTHAHFLCLIEQGDYKHQLAITIPESSQVHIIDHLDVGNEVLRFSAIIRHIAKLQGVKTIILITDHKTYLMDTYSDETAMFTQKINEPFYYTLLNWSGVPCSTYTYNPLVKEWEYVINKPDELSALALAGLTNLHDQEYFLKTPMSFAFFSASLKHAETLVEKFKRRTI